MPALSALLRTGLEVQSASDSGYAAVTSAAGIALEASGELDGYGKAAGYALQGASIGFSVAGGGLDCFVLRDTTSCGLDVAGLAVTVVGLFAGILGQSLGDGTELTVASIKAIKTATDVYTTYQGVIGAIAGAGNLARGRP
jgi:hypothetical protein